VCCLVSISIALFIFPLVKIWWGLRLAKTFDINLVLIMNDYFRCAKKKFFKKMTNILAICKVTKVTILFKWSKAHDILVVKITSWNITETRIMASVLHRSASCFLRYSFTNLNLQKIEKGGNFRVSLKQYYSTCLFWKTKK